MFLIGNDLTPTLKKMSVNDKRFHQSLCTANTLNIYFCDIGSELASALPKKIEKL